MCARRRARRYLSRNEVVFGTALFDSEMRIANPMALPRHPFLVSEGFLLCRRLRDFAIDALGYVDYLFAMARRMERASAFRVHAVQVVTESERDSLRY